MGLFDNKNEEVIADGRLFNIKGPGAEGNWCVYENEIVTEIRHIALSDITNCKLTNGLLMKGVEVYCGSKRYILTFLSSSEKEAVQAYNFIMKKLEKNESRPLEGDFHLTFDHMLTLPSWELTADRIVIKKKKIVYLKDITNAEHQFCNGQFGTGSIKIYTRDGKIELLHYDYGHKKQGEQAFSYIFDKLPKKVQEKKINDLEARYEAMQKTLNSASSQKVNGTNHVLTRAAAGAVIAGPVGGVIGAMSGLEKTVNTHMDASTQSASPAMQTTAAPSVSQVANEIKSLKELLDIGAITQDEFDAKKKQLLGL